MSMRGIASDGPVQQGGDLHLIALKQHHLDRQIRFLVKIAPKAFQIVTTFGS